MPNEKNLKAKQKLVETLTEKIKNSACCVLVDYKGINVADDTKLRRSLREANVDYNVVKNSILERAFRNTNLTELNDLLKGTTALALSETDIIAAPKGVWAQVEISEKTTAEHKFTVKGGFIDGKPVDAATIAEYAKLPSKEVLVSKLLFVLQAPMQKLAMATSEVAKKQA